MEVSVGTSTQTLKSGSADGCWYCTFVFLPRYQTVNGLRINIELYSKNDIATVSTDIDGDIRLPVIVETAHESVLDDPIYCIPRLFILPPLSIKALYCRSQMSNTYQ